MLILRKVKVFDHLILAELSGRTVTVFAAFSASLERPDSTTMVGVALTVFATLGSITISFSSRNQYQSKSYS